LESRNDTNDLVMWLNTEAMLVSTAEHVRCQGHINFMSCLILELSI